ncbi:MAG TPA: 30S ribosomal protein S4e [Candidatus Nanoarchaeia archaeon]|nr:30S ribosomal protein S4e [Candidatus Nanoarchaeia archaeon]
MSGHLKRLAAPKAWKILRKGGAFVCKPQPGSHSQSMALPLVYVLRDMLGVANTLAEVKKLLHSKEILVDGVRRHDVHFSVGLFDVIALKNVNQNYRIILDKKGRLDIKEIPAAEANIKLCKVTGKTMLPKGKIQYHLHDGKNLISTKAAQVGDTMVLTLPSLEVKEVLPLKSGMTVFLTRGKHSADVGQLKAVTSKEATYIVDQEEIGTARDYIFVIGEKKPIITLA